MSAPAPPPENESSDWRGNYFNYFTEVEEHFQRARGTALFLLSPLDWALLESWKNAGVPLEAVLRGINAAFDKWRVRKNKTQAVNSIAYCTQAVMKEAQAIADNAAGLVSQGGEVEAPFPIEQVRKHLETAAVALTALDGFAEIAHALQAILDTIEEHFASPEQLDQRLTALEDKMAAIARTRLSDEDLFQMRRDLDFQLRPYRSKMTADQLARLEKSFLDRKVYERLSLPRLSLFYIG
ncbi:MAG TPA: hypothetical protein PKJ41_18335 [Bryobacteraceae bacterium]|nr:hypothetical protein [Bryobacteraceae bacterium]